MWSHDYCTVCDKQCAPGSMYCSDVCRASELTKSQEVSSTSGSAYTTLYSTCRHHSITSPLTACENPQCSSTLCVCELDSFVAPKSRNSSTSSSSSSSSFPDTPELSPALTTCSSPMSIRSDKFLSSPKSSSAFYSIPPSPLMIPTGYFESTKKTEHQHPEFTSTSSNYRRWLSAV